MTLTTEQLRAEMIEKIALASGLRARDGRNVVAEAIYDEVVAPLLANREAQPAGFYTTVSGRKGVIWHNGAPEDDTAIYTAPPAPAVPEGGE